MTTVRIQESGKHIRVQTVSDAPLRAVAFAYAKWKVQTMGADMFDALVREGDARAEMFKVSVLNAAKIIQEDGPSFYAFEEV